MNIYIETFAAPRQFNRFQFSVVCFYALWVEVEMEIDAMTLHWFRSRKMQSWSFVVVVVVVVDRAKVESLILRADISSGIFIVMGAVRSEGGGAADSATATVTFFFY